MFNNADKMLKKLGFEKLTGDDAESAYGVYYRRENKEYHYNQRLDILHKNNGFHIIQSYVEEANSEGFNNCVGLTHAEIKAIEKKFREMKRKYKWHN